MVILISCKKEQSTADSSLINSSRNTIRSENESATAKNVWHRASVLSIETTGDDLAARCSSSMIPAGIAYLFSPGGNGTTSLYLDITYLSTAVNGYFNFYLRQNPPVGYVPLWSVTHFDPPETGPGIYDFLHYNITLPAGTVFPLILAAQGVPGEGGCRTYIVRFNLL